MKADDWTHALMMCGSENRAGTLVQACRQSPKATARVLLREWFNSCDALAPWRDELREQFERIEYVSDTKEKPRFPKTVYRAAWADDDVEAALSWTADLEFAERFCKGLVGMRAAFLGIKREGVDAYIWRATCWDALGYFTSRNESEIVPAVLTDIEIIGKLEIVRRDPAMSGT